MRKYRRHSLPVRVLSAAVVKPLEAIVILLIRGLARPHNIKRPAPVRGPVATHGAFRPSELGWHDTNWGPLYWSGTNWYDREGRAIF